MNNFFAMGGYGVFVWGSFGLCAWVAVLEPWLIQRRFQLAWQRAKQEARAQQQEAQARIDERGRA
jgi:heme exporter protein D